MKKLLFLAGGIILSAAIAVSGLSFDQGIHLKELKSSAMTYCENDYFSHCYDDFSGITYFGMRQSGSGEF